MNISISVTADLERAPITSWSAKNLRCVIFLTIMLTMTEHLRRSVMASAAIFR